MSDLRLSQWMNLQRQASSLFAAAVLAALLHASRASGQSPRDLLASFSGVVREAGKKALVVEDENQNRVRFHCSGKTQYFEGSKKLAANAVKLGDQVTVEALQALDGSFDAVNVRLERRGGGLSARSP